MKIFMSCRILILAALTIVRTAHGAEAEMVVSPAKRQEILDQTKVLLVSKGQVAPGKDPFHSEAYDESISSNGNTDKGSIGGENKEIKDQATVSAGPRNAHDLLQAIATSPSLKPSGYFVLGGVPTLVFGQKRVKAGNFLTITFEGTEYAIEIVSIDRPNFTLRLNREEFTRPIK